MAPSSYANASFPRRSLHHKLEYEAFIGRVHTSGSPVAEDEICHIENTVLPGINQDVASINGSIASLQSILDSMKEERAALKSLEKSYKTFVPPHRAIPCEIWHEVFSYVLVAESPSSSCKVSGPIWRLSQVCRVWRDVALSHHSAWCTIELNFTEGILEDDVKILELVLARSHQQLLSVKLESCSNAHDEPSMRTAEKMLFSESHRWQSLDLTEFTTPSVYESMQLHGRLAQLELLTISYEGFVDKWRVAEELPVIPIFNDCPRLTRVSLRGARRLIDLPTTQLTELYLCNDLECDVWCHADACAYLRLVAECPSLQVLRMACWRDDSVEGGLPKRLRTTHPNIRRIDIEEGDILSRLTLPQLEEAVLVRRPSCSSHDCSLHSFHRLLRRSNCANTLTYLKIHGMPLSVPWESNDAIRRHLLPSLLSQTKNLRTLDLCMEMSRSSFLLSGSPSLKPDALAIAQLTEVIEALQKPTFLHCLSSLKIDLRGHTKSKVTYFGHSFTSMVEARWAGDKSLGLGKLQRFHFSVSSERLHPNNVYGLHVIPGCHIYHSFSFEEVDVLRTLALEGMDLSFRFSGVEIL